MGQCQLSGVDMSLPTTDASSHTTAADRLHGNPPCVAVTSGLVVGGAGRRPKVGHRWWFCRTHNYSQRNHYNNHLKWFITTRVPHPDTSPHFCLLELHSTVFFHFQKSTNIGYTLSKLSVKVPSCPGHHRRKEAHPVGCQSNNPHGFHPISI